MRQINHEPAQVDAGAIPRCSCSLPDQPQYVGEIPLRRRQEHAGLSLEEFVESGPWLRDGLAAALEEVATAAFIVDESGNVKCANTLGKARHDVRPAAVRKELANAIASDAGAFRKTAVGSTSRPHWLLVAARDQSLAGRLSTANRHWSLTGRQRVIFGALVQGHANKTIAVQLNCAVRTVEQHVTAIFEKAGVDTRAALTAKFWEST